jgi:hypothetical protein
MKKFDPDVSRNSTPASQEVRPLRLKKFDPGVITIFDPCVVKTFDPFITTSFDLAVAVIFDPVVIMIFDPAGNNRFDHAVISKTFDLLRQDSSTLRSRRLRPTHFDPSEPTLRRFF